MSEIEKIKAYIKKSNVPRNRRYEASMKEVLAMATEMERVEAVTLAFEYGRAKGFRMAKARKEVDSHG